MESKKAIYDIMPAELYPKTIFCKAGSHHTQIMQQLERRQFKYPLIAKPDIGGRGRGVKKIITREELLDYATASKMDFLVQEFVPFANEVGIFYCRYPDHDKGFITGIVRKEFLTVKGDGKATIRDLCMKEKRFILQLPELELMYGKGLDEVLSDGKLKVLVPYGNHVRGAKFLDDSHLIDATLVSVVHDICSRVDDFYYGRLDVKFNTWKELKQGKNFSIIELNGAGSEPTHMYDPRHTLLFAWKEIIRHWIILWRISIINHRRGIPYLSFKKGIDMLVENKRFEKNY